MIIKRIARDVNGNIEATLTLSAEQAAFLINMGLVTLVSAGSATVQDMSEEEFQQAIKEGQTVLDTGESDEGNSGVTVPYIPIDPTTLN